MKSEGLSPRFFLLETLLITDFYAIINKALSPYGTEKSVPYNNNIKDADNVKTKKFNCIWVAPVITLAIMLVLYAIGGIYPFGSATTAFSDGMAQYIPFLEELSDKIKNGGSLLFSWHMGAGVNFWPNIAYYLVSPLNLIALFFPVNAMDDAFSLITLIKPVLMALTFGIFLKHYYNKNDWSIPVFSVLWAFSGLMICGMYLTAWYDAIIYFPLVILGLKFLLDGKSAWLYSLFLGLTIISNFYIGWMVCIFCVLYFIYSFIADDDVTYEGVTAPTDGEQESEDGINIFAVFKNSYLLSSTFKFAVSSLIAGALSAIITLPAYKSFAVTGKGTVHSHEHFNFSSIWGLLAGHIYPAKNTYSTWLSKEYIFAFAGIAVCILFVSYFFSKGISARKKIGSAFLIVFFWISFFVHPLTNMWHGFGEPEGIQYRFVFLYSFILIKMAFEAFSTIENIPVLGILSGTAFAGVCTLGLYFDKSLRQEFFSVPLILTVVLFIILFTVILLLNSKKVTVKKTVTIVLLIAIVGETLAFNSKNINTFEFSDNLSEYADVNDAANKLDKSERLTFASKKQTFSNMVMYGQLFGYNSLEYYSSMADENFSVSVNMLGSYGNRLNYQNGAQEQTPVFNLLYPTSYYLDGTGRVSESQFREKIYDKNGYTLFKNNYTMPFMFTVNSNVKDWDPLGYTVPIDNQNEGLKAITGTNDNALVYSEPKNFEYENCEHISVIERMKKVYEDDGAEFPEEARAYYEYIEKKMIDFSFRILDATKPASVSYSAVAGCDGIMYVYIDTKEFTNLTVSLNGKQTDYYTYGIGTGRMYELGNVKKGDTAEFTFGGNDSADSSIKYFSELSSLSSVCFTVDMDKFSKAYEKLDAMSDTELLEFEDTYVKAKVESFEDGLLYIPTAYDGGWTITIDGNEVPLYEHESHILMTDISKGEHIVEMKYCPQGFTAGAVITGVSLLILIAWAVISKKRNDKIKLQEIAGGNVSEE